MQFIKMHGLGNDYVYLDCFKEPVPENPAALSQKVAHRNFGVGGDGLVLILPSEKADLRMRMFNADGSEAEMCGNATRCVGKYAFEEGLVAKKTITLETKGGIKVLDLTVNDRGKVEKVRVDMGRPILEPKLIPMQDRGFGEQVVNEELEAEGKTWRFTAVSMGNPHCVIFVPEVDELPLAQIGPPLEHHPLFPQRVNVEFVKVLAPDHLKMRVWERGSGETMACGTGASATAVAAVLAGHSPKNTPIKVELLGGTLELEWADNDHVYMSGPATEVFRGTLSDEFLEEE